jgi:hypothetical protein
MGGTENIILSKVSQVRNPKTVCFLSHVEYRPQTNTSNIMKNRSCLGGHIERGRVKEGN